MNKGMKIFGIILGIIVLVVLAFFVILHIATLPTPDFLRNESVNGIMMTARVEGDERKPIIKTFKAGEYDNLSDEEIQDLKDKVFGRVEGDIPSLHLNTDKNVYFEFHNKKDIIKLDEDPKIKIYASASDYRDEDKSLREIDGILKNLDDNTYVFEFNRYRTQYEKYFLEPLRVVIYYKVDGEDYVSTFAIFTDNANEGTDYFENETLDEPIPAEV